MVEVGHALLGGDCLLWTVARHPLHPLLISLLVGLAQFFRRLCIFNLGPEIQIFGYLHLSVCLSRK